MSAGVAEPGNADALADFVICHARPEGIDNADDLVSRNDGQFWIRKIAVDDVKVGSADSASLDANPNMSCLRDRIGPLFERQRLADGSEDHGFHGQSVFRN